MRNVDKPITEVIEEKVGMKIAENTALEVVNDFKYLGACMANCHVEFKWRKGLAWSQFWKLATVWKSKEILLSLKLRLLGTLIILKITFYDAETW